MDNVITATKARGSFFNLLNRVLYGGETFFIRKAGADAMVKIEKVAADRPTLMGLAGSISDEDADLMMGAIEKARNRKSRLVPPFDG